MLISPDSATVVSELAILEAEAGNSSKRWTGSPPLAQRQGHPEEAQIVHFRKPQAAPKLTGLYGSQPSMF